MKVVLDRIVQKEDGTVTYQMIDLKRYEQSLTCLKSKVPEWIDSLESCIRKRIRNDETELLDNCITILATNGWERSTAATFGHAALNYVCSRFRIPLQEANVHRILVPEEWDDMLDYAKRYLNLVQDEYKTNCWKLFNATDASNWTNVLKVVELIFTLPVSNGHLEKVFSQVKLIKTNNRTSLHENTLDQLIRINVEGPPLVDWDPKVSVSLWLQDKRRRLNRSDKTQPEPSDKNQEKEPLFSLEGWDDWLHGDCDAN